MKFSKDEIAEFCKLSIAKPNSAKWKTARQSGIGASEASAALGVSQYETPAGLYHLKRGNVPPFAGNERTKMGHIMEPAIRKCFTLQTGIKVVKANPGLFCHHNNAWMLATPDALLENRELLETKKTSHYAAGEYGESGTDEVPTEALVQVQQQLAVCDFDVAHLAVLIDGFELKTYRIERDDVLIKLIIEVETDLWERIVSGDEPEHDWRHPRTAELIKEVYGLEEESDALSVEFSETDAEAWLRYQRLAKHEKLIKQIKTGIKNKLVDKIGSSYCGLFPAESDLGGKMLRRKRIVSEPKMSSGKNYLDTRLVNATK